MVGKRFRKPWQGNLGVRFLHPPRWAIAHGEHGRCKRLIFGFRGFDSLIAHWKVARAVRGPVANRRSATVAQVRSLHLPQHQARVAQR